jgi:hypothetical protein
MYPTFCPFDAIYYGNPLKYLVGDTTSFICSNTLTKLKIQVKIHIFFPRADNRNIHTKIKETLKGNLTLLHGEKLICIVPLVQIYL